MASLQRIRDMYVSEWQWKCYEAKSQRRSFQQRIEFVLMWAFFFFIRACRHVLLNFSSFPQFLHFDRRISNRRFSLRLCFSLSQHMYFRSMICWCVWDMVISSNSFACVLIDCFQPRLQPSTVFANCWGRAKTELMKIQNVRIRLTWGFVFRFFECYYCLIKWVAIQLPLT